MDSMAEGENPIELSSLTLQEKEVPNEISEAVSSDHEEDGDMAIIEEEIRKVQHQILEKHRELEREKLRCTQIAIKQQELRFLKNEMQIRANESLQRERELNDELQMITRETDRVQQTLSKYMQINSINDAFHIWYAGPFGTISNFRLGTLPIKAIDANEINAALGQVALLVSNIAEEACVEFKTYALYPLGSFPKIARVDDRKTLYPLFIDQSSFSFFPKRNFNVALSGFMSCVQELGDFVAAYDPTMAIPYKINVSESKIGDVSFVYGVDDEVWTRSLKFMLSNIKWIVAWYTKHGQTVLSNR